MRADTEQEFVRVLNLCRMFDCDRKTMEKLIEKLGACYAIETLVWNGQLRVNYKQFRRAVLDRANLSF